MCDCICVYEMVKTQRPPSHAFTSVQVNSDEYQQRTIELWNYNASGSYIFTMVDFHKMYIQCNWMQWSNFLSCAQHGFFTLFVCLFLSFSLPLAAIILSSFSLCREFVYCFTSTHITQCVRALARFFCLFLLQISISCCTFFIAWSSQRASWNTCAVRWLQHRTWI